MAKVASCFLSEIEIRERETRPRQYLRESYKAHGQRLEIVALTTGTCQA